MNARSYYNRDVHPPAYEAVEWQTPADVVLRDEEGAAIEDAGGTTTTSPLDALVDKEDLSLGEGWSIRSDVIRTMFQIFANDGPDPAKVLSWVFAVGAHLRISPFCDLTTREKALMLGESEGAVKWRMEFIARDLASRKPRSRREENETEQKRKIKRRRPNGTA